MMNAVGNIVRSVGGVFLSPFCRADAIHRQSGDGFHGWTYRDKRSHPFRNQPQAIAVAAAIGARLSFLTPMAHPVNLIMMGPGNYRLVISSV